MLEALGCRRAPNEQTSKIKMNSDYEQSNTSHQSYSMYDVCMAMYCIRRRDGVCTQLAKHIGNQQLMHLLAIECDTNA